MEPHMRDGDILMVDKSIDDAYVTELEIDFLLCAKIARDSGYRRPNLSLLKVPKKNTI